MRIHRYLRIAPGIIVFCLSAISLNAQPDIHLNRIIEKLERNEVVIGTWFISMSTYTAAGITQSNSKKDSDSGLITPMLDYVLIDMEHMPFDIDRLQNILMAFHSKREVLVKGNLQPSIAAIVRIPCDASGPIEPYIKQVLDAGAHGIIVPHCLNAKDARRVIQACRYPQPEGDSNPAPEGKRGASPRMASYLWGLTPDEYVPRADVWPLDPKGDLMAILMIEDVEGGENIEEILDVPGVGGIFFGLYDYSFSCGAQGNMEAAAVKKAFDKAAAACQKRDIPMIVSADPKNVNDRLQSGFKMLIVGSDTKPSNNIQEVYKKVHGQD